MIAVKYNTYGYGAWTIDKIEQEKAIIRWCYENFPDGKWLVYTDRVEFEDEKDAVLFALRW